MSASYIVEEAEEKWRKQVAAEIRKDAAALIASGTDRATALREATKRVHLAIEAEDDVTGTLGTLAEAQRIEIPEGKERQVHAIARDLGRAH